jgi:dienelactone hydrolase
MDDIVNERPKIITSSPYVLTEHNCRARRRTMPLSSELYRPATAKPPFPAEDISEGLVGVKTARERRYGRFLAQNGFAALVVDSFDTRGHKDTPDPVRAIRVTVSMMLADAFMSLEWLAARDDIDASRITNIGFSYGGMISILTAYEQIRRHFVEGDARFAAHVSYYGPTVPRLEDYATTGAPVAVMNGALDNNFNPERAELIAGDLEKGGSAVENIVFADAYHQWDSDDHERRFDRFSIRRLATRIAPDCAIFDECNGRRIEGFASRLLMIARAVSLKGFHLMRDEDVLRKSDEILLRTLSATAEEAGQENPVAAAERAGRTPPPVGDGVHRDRLRECEEIAEAQ